jgi:hypothetical protein
VPLICAGGCVMSPSDRNLKRDLAPVDGEQILDSLAELPITTWRYKTESADARHIGPMAQDFKAKFGVGTDEKYILQVDADGVALAAIKTPVSNWPVTCWGRTSKPKSFSCLPRSIRSWGQSSP